LFDVQYSGSLREAGNRCLDSMFRRLTRVLAQAY
jgi:hypothetical protein